MSLWAGVLIASGLVYSWKLLGHLVPRPTVDARAQIILVPWHRLHLDRRRSIMQPTPTRQGCDKPVVLDLVFNPAFASRRYTARV